MRITNFGVVNYYKYIHENISLTGDAVVVRGENGTGKTTLVTAVFTSIFSLDLRQSVNAASIGKTGLKDPRFYLREHNKQGQPSYVYAEFQREDGAFITLVNSHILSGTTQQITSHGYIFEGYQISQIKMINPKTNTTYSHVDFKRENNIMPLSNSFSYNKKDEYMEHIGQVIFGTNDIKLVKDIILIWGAMSIPLINFGGSQRKTSEAKLGIDDIHKNVNRTLPDYRNLLKVDHEGRSTEIKTYIDEVSKFLEVKQALENNKRLKASINEDRKRLFESLDNKRNRKIFKDNLHEINANYEKSKHRLEGLVDGIKYVKESIATSESKINELSADIKSMKSEKERLENELKESDLVKAIEMQKLYIQMIENELNNNQANLKAKESDILTTTAQLSNKKEEREEKQELIDELDYEINNMPYLTANTDLETVSEQIELVDENAKTLSKVQTYKSRLIKTQTDLDSILEESSILEEMSHEQLKELQEKWVTFGEELHISIDIDSLKNNYNTFKERVYVIIQEKRESLSRRQFEIERLIKETINEQKTHQREIEQLQQETKPTSSSIYEKGTHYFENVEFKEGLSEKEQSVIEGLLLEAGLLFVLLDAENVTKGIAHD